MIKTQKNERIAAVLREVPVNLLPAILPFYRKIAKTVGLTVRMRYRGPRSHRYIGETRMGITYRKQSFCLAKDATRVSLYVDMPRNVYRFSSDYYKNFAAQRDKFLDIVNGQISL